MCTDDIKCFFLLTDMLCVICQEDKLLDTTTPCGHAFHQDCLKSIQRPYCPVCKHDIRHFLTNTLAVPAKDLQDRIMEDNDRILYESICQQSTAALTPEQCAMMVCYQILHNKGELIYSLRDILLDRIWDARKYFLHISSSRRGEGVFTYFFEWNDTIAYALDPHLPSQAIWEKADSPYEGHLHRIIKDLVDRVRPFHETDFGVLLALYDPESQQLQTSGRVLTTDAHRQNQLVDNAIGGGYVSGVTANLRPSHRDIVCSLARGVSCRSQNHQPYEPNPEFQWARKVSKRIHKKEGSRK